MIKIELDKYLTEIEITAEHWTDIDGSQNVDYYKRAALAEELALYLYDSGQASLEYRGHEVETFIWDDEAAAMFDRFDELRAVELFEMIYRKRWRSVCE